MTNARAAAVCGSAIRRLNPLNGSIATIAIAGMPVTCGIVSAPVPHFDATARLSARHALVRVRAFSCNFRDKALILRAAAAVAAERFWVLGSEFAGEVVAIGAEVASLSVGDRVIGDNAYPRRAPRNAEPGIDDAHDTPRGIPTSNASREYLVLHESQLVRVPSSMPDDVAAAFSIGAQTAYSMVDKLAVAAGDTVLVTSGRANTSLCAIRALRARGVRIVALTSREEGESALRALGVELVARTTPGATSLGEHEELRAASERIGGFDGVIDPYFDLHLRAVLPLVADGARYVTCGFYDQYLALTGEPFPGPRPDYAEALRLIMAKNVHLIGNCLGERAHLARAIEDYTVGRYDVTLDSVWRGDDAGPFVARTFDAPDRLGKVVYAYA